MLAMPFRVYVILCNLAPVLFFAPAVLTIYSPYGWPFPALGSFFRWFFVALCVTGAVLGLLMALRVRAMRCPECGTWCRFGGTKYGRFYLWLDCDRCGKFVTVGRVTWRITKIPLKGKSAKPPTCDP